MSGIRNTAKQLAVAVFGLAVGGLFLWLALRQVEAREVWRAVAGIHYPTLLVATIVYWAGIGTRVIRWQLLLRQLKPVPTMKVGETLIVGYAVNNLLPARLGEVARAAYAKRRLQIGRARVFGSIFIERFLDLIAISGCLLVGLVALRWNADFALAPTFELIALQAGAVIGVLILVVAIFRSEVIERFKMPPALSAILGDFRLGLATLSRKTVVSGCALTLAVWLLECAAVAQVYAATGIDLNVSQSLLLIGAAALSTLVPTAPGYLGTYQLVAVLAMSSFGLNTNAGIVAATATQLALFGSLTLVGIVILATRGVRRLMVDGVNGLRQPSTH